jgi:hypothetical protein
LNADSGCAAQSNEIGRFRAEMQEAPLSSFVQVTQPSEEIHAIMSSVETPELQTMKN